MAIACLSSIPSAKVSLTVFAVEVRKIRLTDQVVAVIFPGLAAVG
jgi:hypothetical protein